MTCNVSVPDAAIMTATKYKSNVNSVTIVASAPGAAVTAGFNSLLNGYTKTSGPGTASRTSQISDMTISGLAAGQLHIFKFKATSSCASGDKESLVESAEYKACTR